ncbi:alpha/beta hydrolase family protein [Winogradskyella aurantiaca]|uniref:alpha/beta hydrolase family protein n=1 Tax=Winogradskyella aurantiaca TaxID=2219558 RepID=UPI0018E54AA5|nr:alpha/beta fold hydrolase [Winogradskyella aurantiaca]
MIKASTNIVLQRHDKKPILIDCYINTEKEAQPLIVFCHGYKGYKDWGAWSLMAIEFAKAGFAFVKFNFSHNGGTIEQPIDFPDLEAFGQNNYSKELDDLGDLIDWTVGRYKDDANVNTNRIILIGHSRGGGIVLLKAAEDPRITEVITLAGVSDYKVRFPKGEAFIKWNKDGVYFIKNGRTLQDMPHYFQYYEDFVANEERLSISKAAMSIKCPYLIVHGTADEAVKHEEAERLHSWCRHSQLLWFEGANHVFGMKQPWKEPQLPKEMVLVLEACYRFLS